MDSNEELSLLSLVNVEALANSEEDVNAGHPAKKTSIRYIFDSSGRKIGEESITMDCCHPDHKWYVCKYPYC